MALGWGIALFRVIETVAVDVALKALESSFKLFFWGIDKMYMLTDVSLGVVEYSTRDMKQGLRSTRGADELGKRHSGQGSLGLHVYNAD
ncbi:hypothetical protein C8F01DRAFT_1101465 [Mycena amicta]|nr:hypothetical protein C8F01DRAFT_1101465 [Mycena amicta]